MVPMVPTVPIRTRAPVDRRTETPMAAPDQPVSLRRSPALHGIETLTARYLRQHFKPHAHDEYLIGVIDGGVHSVWCRGHMHHVPGGSLVTMRPGEVHHGGASDARGWHQRMIYVPEAAMRAIMSDIADAEVAAPLDFRATFHANTALAQRFAQLHEVLHRSTDTLLRDEALDALMRCILPVLAPAPVALSAASRSGRAAAVGRMEEVIDYLMSRIDEDVSLDALCALSGLRRRQTIEAFRRHTGLPPHAWHLQQKIERVKQLLRTGHSATDAAMQAGFADQSHMARHFNAIVGVTPGVYARAQDRTFVLV